MKNSINASRISKVLLIILVVFSSCKKEEDVIGPPQIYIMSETGYVSGDTTMAAGEEIRLKVKMMKGDNNITNFTIDVFTESVQTYFDTGMNVGEIVWEGSFIKSLAPVEEWTFTVRDREGAYGQTSLTISLDTGIAYNPLHTYSALTLGAPDNDQQEGCFSVAGGGLYFHEEAAADTVIQSDIDLLYFYSAEDKNTIASPGANIEDGIFTVNPGSWTVVNTTRYYKTSLTADDFNSAENDSIIIANYEEGEAKRKAKKLLQNDIYTFKTQCGKLGILMVNEVTGTNEGSVNIDIKIQQ